MRMTIKEAVKKGLIKPPASSLGAGTQKMSTSSSNKKTRLTKLEKLRCSVAKLEKTSYGFSFNSDNLPSSMNAILGMHGLEWNKYAKAWKKLANDSVLEAGRFKQSESWVIVRLTRAGKKSMGDLDGIIVKPIIDGMVLAGVFSDDNPDVFKVSPFIIQSRGSREGLSIEFHSGKHTFLEAVTEHLSTCL